MLRRGTTTTGQEGTSHFVLGLRRDKKAQSFLKKIKVAIDCKVYSYIYLMIIIGQFELVNKMKK